MKTLINNLEVGCCATTFVTVGVKLNEVKLYKTIAEAFAKNGNHSWFSLIDVAALNNKDARPAKINCHTNNNKCVISLITYNVNGSVHYDYCLADEIEIR